MGKSIEARVARLEAICHTADETAAGPGACEMEAARQRVVARVFCHIGERLDIPHYPTVKAARERLAGDTPEQHAADLDVLQRWEASHPGAFPQDEAASVRLMAKLDEMERRREAYELRA